MDLNTQEAWLILKGTEKKGPYSYTELLHFRQKGMLFDFDYVWNQKLDQWTAVAELPEFSTDRIHRIFEKAISNEVFCRRKMERKRIAAPLLIHDNSRVWSGELRTLSQGAWDWS